MSPAGEASFLLPDLSPSVGTHFPVRSQDAGSGPGCEGAAGGAAGRRSQAAGHRPGPCVSRGRVSSRSLQQPFSHAPPTGSRAPRRSVPPCLPLPVPQLPPKRFSSKAHSIVPGDGSIGRPELSDGHAGSFSGRPRLPSVTRLLPPPCRCHTPVGPALARGGRHAPRVWCGRPALSPLNSVLGATARATQRPRSMLVPPGSGPNVLEPHHPQNNQASPWAGGGLCPSPLLSLS